MVGIPLNTLSCLVTELRTFYQMKQTEEKVQNGLKKENEQCVGACIKPPAQEKERTNAAIFPLPVNIRIHFLCLCYCRNLSKLLFTSPLSICKGIYLCLVRSIGRDPEILIFCLHLKEGQGNGMVK